MRRSGRSGVRGKRAFPAANPLGVGLLVCCALAVLTGQAQPADRFVALENARLLTMDGYVIDNGVLLVQGAKIVALGNDVKIPSTAERIDAAGKTITPGLIDAGSALGVGVSTRGSADATRRAEDAFDRYDTFHLVDALRHGVTTIHLTPPGSAGVRGTGAVVRLIPSGASGSIGQVLRSEAALCLDFGSSGKPITRLKTFASIRKQFREAIQYRLSLEYYEEDLAEYTKKLAEREAENKAKETEAPDGSSPTTADEDEEKKDEEKKEDGKEEEKKDEAKLKKPTRPARKPQAEVLLRAIDGEIPVRVLAERSDDIFNALELAESFSLRLIVEGAAEAHLLAGELAKAEARVVLGQTVQSGVRRDDPYRRAARYPALALEAAGVRWVIGSGARSELTTRFVALSAQLAVPRGRAGHPLKIVTADAADLLGVADKTGRLRAGLLADFVVWSGDPLEPDSRVEAVYVGGTRVYEDDSRKGQTP